MKLNLTRRRFLARTAALGAALASAGRMGRALSAAGLDLYHPPLDLAVARGESPVKNCLAAVEALGGFHKFVHPGDLVVVKPNPIGGNPPEMAINTHPEMVEAVVRECVAAGAGRVVVLSHDELRSFEGNGTAAAVRRAGGTIKAAQDRSEYREIPVPRGRILRTVEIAGDVLDADVFINMPIAKHHAGSRVTLAMKNLMGINWDRITFHRTDLHQCISELAGAIRHNLVIMDANHVLLSNGPAGPGEVLKARQVIAGIDPVAVDAFAARFFNLDPSAIAHIQGAYDLGVGEIDMGKLAIKEFDA
ncbi:MAG: DUF362 domain-containing protein [Candidatus Eisenbacteria bacterium]|nr:DUF362 domain-containing protein [Candidatus Eisenbacteria bacterium]